jgi:hypothetical protein
VEPKTIDLIETESRKHVIEARKEGEEKGRLDN